MIRWVNHWKALLRAVRKYDGLRARRIDELRLDPAGAERAELPPGFDAALERAMAAVERYHRPLVREGHRAVMVYLAQRSDAARFRLAHDIDPAYMDAWKAARDAGVESIALACHMGDDEIVADRLIDLDVT